MPPVSEKREGLKLQCLPHRIILSEKFADFLSVTLSSGGAVSQVVHLSRFSSRKRIIANKTWDWGKICRTCTDKQTRNWATSRFQNHNPYSQNPCCTDAINLSNFQKKLQPIQTHGASAQITPDLQLAKIFPINLSKIAPNMWDVV